MPTAIQIPSKWWHRASWRGRGWLWLTVEQGHRQRRPQENITTIMLSLFHYVQLFYYFLSLIFSLYLLFCCFAFLVFDNFYVFALGFLCHFLVYCLFCSSILLFVYLVFIDCFHVLVFHPLGFFFVFFGCLFFIFLLFLVLILLLFCFGCMFWVLSFHLLFLSFFIHFSLAVLCGLWALGCLAMGQHLRGGSTKSRVLDHQRLSGSREY